MGKVFGVKGWAVVEFVFECGYCVVWGEPVVSWWTQKYRVDDFNCWACGELCAPHDPPWTEA
ncbi:hypothetical protein [Streptomyces sp. NPDC060243]|uniref:hypothetical protein n=1 Tax=Streptomyces sp. NPDC060243 TaxID=3347081 RepID=UPI003658ECD8